MIWVKDFPVVLFLVSGTLVSAESWGLAMAWQTAVFDQSGGHAAENIMEAQQEGKQIIKHHLGR